MSFVRFAASVILGFIFIVHLSACDRDKQLTSDAVTFDVSFACATPRDSGIPGIIICHAFDQSPKGRWVALQLSDNRWLLNNEVRLTSPLYYYDRDNVVTKTPDRVTWYYRAESPIIFDLPDELKSASGFEFSVSKPENRLTLATVNRNGELEVWVGKDNLVKGEETLNVYASGSGFLDEELVRIYISENGICFRVVDGAPKQETRVDWLVGLLEEQYTMLDLKKHHAFVFSDEIVMSNSNVKIIAQSRNGAKLIIDQIDTLETDYAGKRRTTAELSKIDNNSLALKAEGKRAPSDITSKGSKLVPLNANSVAVFDSIYQRTLVLTSPDGN